MQFADKDIEAFWNAPCCPTPDAYHLCFTWENGEATGVEFCDYH